ncbi:MAG: hypothetical protein BYD32DRAFT_416399 [Podila humilis]|nr:MAG: hypothetical protein BYD32DRAFT_416399 [Podila humilis]
MAWHGKVLVVIVMSPCMIVMDVLCSKVINQTCLFTWRWGGYRVGFSPLSLYSCGNVDTHKSYHTNNYFQTIRKERR